MKCEGSDIQVWRGERNGDSELVLETSSADLTTSAHLMFRVHTDNDFDYDDIWIVSDDLTMTSTYTYDDANELLTMARGNAGTTTFTYDDWGRMVSKHIGSFTATYAYQFTDQLSTVTTNFGDEDDATYLERTDGSTYRRTVDGTTTQYRPGGLNAMNEETSGGTLTRTYIGRTAAHVDGASPSTGDYAYYLHDHLGSTRDLRDEDKDSLGHYEYTPYGEVYAAKGKAITRMYTGHEWDPAAQLYLAPARAYDPATAHWTTREPLGLDGPNLYDYALGNPIVFADPTGLYAEVEVDPNNNVTITLPITFTGVTDPEARKTIVRGIKKHWTGNFDGYNVTVKVKLIRHHGFADMSRRERKKVNTIELRNGRAGIDDPAPAWVERNHREGVYYLGNYRDSVCSKEHFEWVAAHEAGHHMGLPDRRDASKPLGIMTSFEPGHWSMGDLPPSFADIQEVIDNW